MLSQPHATYHEYDMVNQGIQDTQLQDRYQQVQDRIAAAADASGRDPASITLVAVTKYTDHEAIKGLYQLGQRDFGESRVQQLTQRVPITDELANQAGQPIEARWHMIGHLQRNKVKKLLPAVHLIHSVDSRRLASEIDQHTDVAGKPTEVLLQVNASGEAAKFGVDPEEADRLFEHMLSLPGLRVRGVMTMAAYSDDPEAAGPTFARTRAIFDRYRETASEDFNILSMGMTGDFEVAIREGATMVRVGRALFEND